MKKIILLIFTIALISKTSQSNAAGLILGATLDLPKNFFVGADAFANYYDEDIINHNYGLKGNFGYKIFGASAYVLGGVQHSGFATGESENFNNNTSPIYGAGVGYTIPIIGIGVRLEQTYFELERSNGSNKNFAFTNLALSLVF